MFSFKGVVHNLSGFNSDYYITKEGTVFSIDYHEKIFSDPSLKNIKKTTLGNVLLTNTGNPIILENKSVYEELREELRVNIVHDNFIGFLRKKPNNLNGIYDLETKQYLFETNEWIGRDIIGELLIGVLNGKIIIRNLKDGVQIWNKEVSYGTYTNTWQEEKPHEVKKFIGVWNSQLIVLLTGGKFIGLNVEDGSLLWQINDVTRNETNQQIDYGFGDPYNPFLDEEAGHIYILQGESFIDLDLNTLEATYKWNVKDDIPENYPFIRQSRIFDRKIYFTARNNLSASNDNMIGIFDIEKKEIVWDHVFDFEKGVFIPNAQDNIQINEKNLLVLDNSGTLYIFERENTTT